MGLQRSDQPFPKKHLGQNFLTDKKVLDKIIHACDLTAEDTVLEIGPGLGALTERIAPQVASFYAVEKDKDLYLKLVQQFNNPDIHLIHGDILRFDFHQISGLTKIIGNLPYNISTPIIERLLKEPELHKTFYFTVQWEFGKRLAAKKGGKDYGSLSCFVQYFCDVNILFRIRNTAFWPVPKVTSCFIQLKPRTKKVFANNEKLLFKIIRQAFQQRRKKITNSLEGIIEKAELIQILAKSKIKPDLRAENLALEDYIKISNDIDQRGKGSTYPNL